MNANTSKKILSGFASIAMLLGLATSAAAQDKCSDPRVEKAKAEGTLVVYSSIFETPETQAAHREAFIKYWCLPDDFEFKWDIRSTSALIGAIEAEASAGKIAGDVTTMPSITWFLTAVDRKLLMAYDSPEYAEFKLPEKIGLNNRPYWVSDMYMFVPIWNANELPDIKMESWTDLLKPELKGKMVILDGSTLQSVALAYYYLKQRLPEGFFQKLAQQDVAVVVSSLQAMDMMTSGERPLSIFGVSADANQLYDKGADFVRTATPKEGVMLQEQATAIFADAPHPNAAQLWIDFLRSHDGQVLFEKMEGRVPGRAGVPSSNPMTPDADDLFEVAFAPDYRKMAADTELVKRAQAEFAEIFGR
jgi:iron(III) transport system substrate-binding protein